MLAFKSTELVTVNVWMHSKYLSIYTQVAEMLLYLVFEVGGSFGSPPI